MTWLAFAFGLVLGFVLGRAGGGDDGARDRLSREYEAAKRRGIDL